MEIFASEDEFLSWKAEKYPCTVYSHTSVQRGYTSDKIYGVAFPYIGKYGRGFRVIRNFEASMEYSAVDYYLIPRFA